MRFVGYDVTTSTGDLVQGRFDAVLYVLGMTIDGRSIERIGELRGSYPGARVIVYSSRPVLEDYRREIEEAGAVPLEMIKTTQQIAAML